jgi:hypothetical protein
MPLLKRSVKLRSSSRVEALPHMDLYQTSAVAEYEGLPALDNDADQLLMTGHGLPRSQHIVCPFLSTPGTGSTGACTRAPPAGPIGAAPSEPVVDLSAQSTTIGDNVTLLLNKSIVSRASSNDLS